MVGPNEISSLHVFGFPPPPEIPVVPIFAPPPQATKDSAVLIFATKFRRTVYCSLERVTFALICLASMMKRIPAAVWTDAALCSLSESQLLPPFIRGYLRKLLCLSY